jgi:hypothetical protein
MKKIYILISLLFAATWSFGQTVLFEGFNSGEMPPEGWSLTLPDQWSASQTSYAGGSSPEGRFESTNITGTSRLVSMMLDMTGYSSITLFFKHFYENANASGPTVGVATRANWGPWHNVWQINPTTDVGPEEIQVVINNADMGKTGFQICFFIDGNLLGLNNWYIDDILLMNPLEMDAQVAGITTPSTIMGAEPVGTIIRNIGNTTVTQLGLSWQEYNGTIHSTTVEDLALELYDTLHVRFDGMWISPYGTFPLSVWIDQVNGGQDEFLGNDTLTKNISRIVNILPQKPLFEEFTSSTCGPCASFNSSFVPWCQEHADEITLVKYQMNWPGSGDPYYTAEGGVRRGYYGVNAVPWLFCNGANVATSLGAVQTAFANESQKMTYLEFASSFSVTGTTINVKANLLPYNDYSGSKKIHIVVVEKVTTQNVGGNGETAFHHVMMKMIPDAYGTTVSLSDRNPVSINHTVNLSSTYIEEYDDLAVVVFVQDDSDKSIMQSYYALEDVTMNTDARLSSVTLDGVPLEGFDPNVYEYEIILPEGQVTEPYLEATPMDNDAFVISEPAFQVPGTAHVQVFAEDRYNEKNYNFHYTIYTGVDEKPRPSVQVYPNPASNQIFITGLKNAQVSFLTIDGKQVRKLEGFSGNSIDVSDLPRGAYILNIIMEDANAIRKRVIIL